MVRKGNPKNIQAIDDVCGVRAAAGLGTVGEAMFRGLSDKCMSILRVAHLCDLHVVGERYATAWRPTGCRP